MKKGYVLRRAASAAAVVAALALAPGLVRAGGKADICHVRGNGIYHLINISVNAVPAHLAHGDAMPGDLVDGKVVGDDCSLLDTVLIESVKLYYGSTGWGGWSCPAGMQVADAWIEGITPAQSAIWVPGASLAGVDYPATPFGYTYTPPEEGFIAQAGPVGGEATIYLLCF